MNCLHTTILDKKPHINKQTGLNKNKKKTKNYLKMSFSLNFLVLAFFLASSTCCLAQQTITVEGVTVTWQNLGTKTVFTASSSLGNGVDISDSWLGVGINTAPKMVCAWIFKANLKSDYRQRKKNAQGRFYSGSLSQQWIEKERESLPERKETGSSQLS